MAVIKPLQALEGTEVDMVAAADVVKVARPATLVAVMATCRVIAPKVKSATTVSFIDYISVPRWY